MKKSAIQQPPCYFDRYIALVPDIELEVAFQQAEAELGDLDRAQLVRLGDSVYAAGKWTVRGIFQHLIDAERVLGYRALRFARNDQTRLPGFDEAVFAANVDTRQRSLDSILAELATLRRATASMFAWFDERALLRIGIASDMEMSPLAYGFAILGHQKHHLAILESRYYPLVAS